MEENYKKITKSIELLISKMLEKSFFDSNKYNLVVKETDNICNCFVESGLLEGFKNVCDDSNNTAYIKSQNMLVMDTYLKFKDITYVVNTTIISNMKIDFKCKLDIDLISFRNEIFSNTDFDSPVDRLNFLNSKLEIIRKYKMTYINEQNFEPAADCRDTEKWLMGLISKVSIGIGEKPGAPDKKNVEEV